MNANLDQLVTGKVLTTVPHQASVFLERRDEQDQESNQGGVIEFQATIPLVIHLGVQEILAGLDHCLNLAHYMNYLTKTGSRHGLSSWIPSWMNDGIKMNKACTLINHTQKLLPLVLNTHYTSVPPKNLSRGISEPQKNHIGLSIYY